MMLGLFLLLTAMWTLPAYANPACAVLYGGGCRFA